MGISGVKSLNPIKKSDETPQVFIALNVFLQDIILNVLDVL